MKLNFQQKKPLPSTMTLHIKAVVNMEMENLDEISLMRRFVVKLSMITNYEPTSPHSRNQIIMVSYFLLFSYPHLGFH